MRCRLGWRTFALRCNQTNCACLRLLWKFCTKRTVCMHDFDAYVCLHECGFNTQGVELTQCTSGNTFILALINQVWRNSHQQNIEILMNTIEKVSCQHDQPCLHCSRHFVQHPHAYSACAYWSGKMIHSHDQAVLQCQASQIRHFLPDIRLRQLADFSEGQIKFDQLNKNM